MASAAVSSANVEMQGVAGRAPEGGLYHLEHIFLFPFSELWLPDGASVSQEK